MGTYKQDTGQRYELDRIERKIQEHGLIGYDLLPAKTIHRKLVGCQSRYRN